MLTRLGLAMLWLLHFLPLSWLAAIGNAFGRLLYRVGHERRDIVLTNLRLCFPDLTEARRDNLARRHFQSFGRSVLERGLLWWADAARIRRLIRVNGIENLNFFSDRPVILLVPHFVALDMTWTRLTLERDMTGIYAQQKNPVFNSVLVRGRVRFGASLPLSRQEGPRRGLRAMRDGLPFFYLPDMDYGPRDSIFVPFFGVPTATITGLARLARMTDAAVVPCLSRMLPGGAGYEVDILPAWEGFPGETIEADTRRMNSCIEDWIKQMPEQYYWLHKRFKTRPPGEPRIY